jgi:hypothetical protein
MGDHRLHRLALGDRRACYTNLVIAKYAPGSDRSEERTASFASAPVAAFRSSGKSRSRTRVPSARDRRHRSGDLRFASRSPARSMARQERGENGKERAVASRATGREEQGSGARGACAGAQRTLWRRGSRASRRRRSAGRRPAGPFAEARRQPGSHPSSPTQCRSRFLRRALTAPASPTSFSATPRTRWISGSSIWPARSLQFTGRGSADIAPNDTGISPVSRATTRENGRSSSSGPFALPRAPVHARRVHADRLSGLGRVLA